MMRPFTQKRVQTRSREKVEDLVGTVADQVEAVEGEGTPRTIPNQSLQPSTVGGLDADAGVQTEPTAMGERCPMRAIATVDRKSSRLPIPSTRYEVSVFRCLPIGGTGVGIGCSSRMEKGAYGRCPRLGRVWRRPTRM